MNRPDTAEVAAACVPGRRHVLSARPCEDAVAAVRDVEGVVLAVADGHGHARYTHAAEGARLACEAAVDVLRRILTELPHEVDSLGVLHDELSRSLPRQLVFEWNRRVKHHIAMRQRLARGSWPDDVGGTWTQGVRAYGTTLLAAAFSDRIAIWLQIGDGDILRVSPEGRAERVFPRPPKQSQATTSLAMRGCIDHIRFEVSDLRRKPVELAVLTSDGVGDRYDHGTFETLWGTQLLQTVRDHGWARSVVCLPTELAGLARDGDDASAALAWLPEPTPQLFEHSLDLDPDELEGLELYEE